MGTQPLETGNGVAGEIKAALQMRSDAATDLSLFNLNPLHHPEQSYELIP